MKLFQGLKNIYKMIYKRQAARLLRDITGTPARRITNYSSKEKIESDLLKHGVVIKIK